MFDINALFLSAITAAVAEATKPLAAKVEALEQQLAQAKAVNDAAQPAGATPAAITADAFVTHLDNQEWFWHKLHTYVEGCIENNLQSAIENAIEDHTSDYDHDDFVTRGDVEAVVSDEVDNRDIVTKDEVEDMIDDKLSGKIDDKINEAIEAHTSNYDHDDFVEEATVDSKIEEAMTTHHENYNHDMYVTDAYLREFLRKDVKVSIDC